MLIITFIKEKWKIMETENFNEIERERCFGKIKYLKY